MSGDEAGVRVAILNESGYDDRRCEAGYLGSKLGYLFSKDIVFDD